MASSGANARNRGLQYERDVAQAAREEGVLVKKVERQGYHVDPGDLVGPDIEDWVFDCKKRARTELGAWLDEVEEERKELDRPYGAIIHPRRGGPRSGDYVTMRASTFWSLIREIRDGKIRE